jgi:hypothetical protein
VDREDIGHETEFIWFAFMLNLILKIIHSRHRPYRSNVLDIILHHLPAVKRECLYKLFAATDRGHMSLILQLKVLVDVPKKSEPEHMYHDISRAAMPAIVGEFLRFASWIESHAGKDRMGLIHGIRVDSHCGGYDRELSTDESKLSNHFLQTLKKATIS